MASEPTNQRPTQIEAIACKSSNQRPTRIKAISTLLWKSFINGSKKIASATAPARTEPELSDLTEKVRASIAKVDSKFIHNLMQGDEAKPVILESIKAITELDLNTLGFTSWCKLGLYEADFGGGRPIWIISVGVRGSVFINFVLLCDTRNGDEIEAWVTMDESDMDVLCKDSEVGRFASMDLSSITSKCTFAHQKLV
ncbi:hypothetical protein QQ045_001054 [Rhodiola kirilowii]